MNIYYVIIASFTVILSIAAIIAPFVLMNSVKTLFHTKIETNALKIQGLGQELESIKTDIGRLKFDHYDTLLQKITGMQGELSLVSQETKSLDATIKNFYSKWARKLGDMKKQVPEPATLEEPIQEELELPPGFALEPSTPNNVKTKPSRLKSKFFA